jgi:plastocyanin
VDAGSTVRMEFKNRGSLPHNFAVYESELAQQEIFTGDIITEGEILYTFEAPAAPGSYFFRCDVHPVTMTGTLVVT